VNCQNHRNYPHKLTRFLHAIFLIIVALFRLRLIVPLLYCSASLIVLLLNGSAMQYDC